MLDRIAVAFIQPVVISVARLSKASDAGGFLDISLDFLFYASIPLAFAIAMRIHWGMRAFRDEQ